VHATFKVSITIPPQLMQALIITYCVYNFEKWKLDMVSFQKQLPIPNSRLEVAYCVYNHQKKKTPSEEWQIFQTLIAHKRLGVRR
jgi:hypothetical protein